MQRGLRGPRVQQVQGRVGGEQPGAKGGRISGHGARSGGAGARVELVGRVRAQWGAPRRFPTPFHRQSRPGSPSGPRLRRTPTPRGCRKSPAPGESWGAGAGARPCSSLPPPPRPVPSRRLARPPGRHSAPAAACSRAAPHQPQAHPESPTWPARRRRPRCSPGAASLRSPARRKCHRRPPAPLRSVPTSARNHRARAGGLERTRAGRGRSGPRRGKPRREPTAPPSDGRAAFLPPPRARQGGPPRAAWASFLPSRAAPHRPSPSPSPPGQGEFLKREPELPSLRTHPGCNPACSPALHSAVWGSPDFCSPLGGRTVADPTVLFSTNTPGVQVLPLGPRRLRGPRATCRRP